MPDRTFPPPWSVEEGETYLVVKDANDQNLGYVYFDDPRQRTSRSPATRRSQRSQAAGHFATIAFAGKSAERKPRR
jgi:hypothetical protein